MVIIIVKTNQFKNLLLVNVHQHPEEYNKLLADNNGLNITTYVFMIWFNSFSFLQDLEKNLQLCETHYGHQVVNEQRKLEEERNFTSYLQEQLEQLSKETEVTSRGVLRCSSLILKETHNEPLLEKNP